MRKSVLFIGMIILFAFVAFAVGCNSPANTATGKTIATGPAGNNLTATISNADGSFRKGSQEFTLTFADASGKLPTSQGNALIEGVCFLVKI